MLLGIRRLAFVLELGLLLGLDFLVLVRLLPAATSFHEALGLNMAFTVAVMATVLVLVRCFSFFRFKSYFFAFRLKGYVAKCPERGLEILGLTVRNGWFQGSVASGRGADRAGQKGA